MNKVNYLMTKALDMAHKAYGLDEVPVGCLITDSFGKILAQTHNTKEMDNNACSHAEILAIKKASEKLGRWRLIDCEVYVTLEPCPMCLSALGQARAKKLFFGAYDKKGGAISLGFNLHNNSKLNYTIDVCGGVKHIECSRILSNFFQEKRKKYKPI